MAFRFFIFTEVPFEGSYLLLDHFNIKDLVVRCQGLIVSRREAKYLHTCFHLVVRVWFNI